MELIVHALQKLPEYETIRKTLRSNRSVGVSGAAQINRSHLIAALYRDFEEPIFVLCQDELACRRTQEELAAFTGISFPILPSRELTFYNTTAASRQWEQKRLRLLYRMATGAERLVIASWEAVSLRTLPKHTLLGAAINLRPGEIFDLEELATRLIQSGYTRCQMVEGVGQFAIRGGILDIYSPAMENPLRVEFFGDELDAMGLFDPLTQRRSENVEQAVILPVAETLPMLHPGGLDGLCDDLEKLVARQKRRRTPNETLIHTLQSDLETLQTRSFFGASDRYLSLIYPELCTAADYLPAAGFAVFCDHGNLRRAAAGAEENLGLQLDALLQDGVLAGELCEFSRDWDGLCASLKGHPTVFLDAFLSAAYPEDIQPAALVELVAKQLPSYGGNLDIAAQDLAHYQKNRYRTLVLCGNRRRGEILEAYLRDKGIGVTMAFPATGWPPPGGVYLTDGSLPSGMEYPTIKLAVLTEGQLLTKAARKPRSRVKTTNR
ncbi:MAG: transcription-repair coupling factor, partial [Oscillospiraceae bacterium]|nr:transcription-repair coupling factor [Oscillospiraceae bacterium]